MLTLNFLANTLISNPLTNTLASNFLTNTLTLNSSTNTSICNLLFIVFANTIIINFVILLVTFAYKQKVASKIDKKQLKTIIEKQIKTIIKKNIIIKLKSKIDRLSQILITNNIIN